MTTERENLAWHVAGRAYAATMYKFPVHKLSLDGFSEADLQDCGDAQRLDPWTMIRLPVSRGPVGTFHHTLTMEYLMTIAIAGPAVELLHRKLPCVLPNVQQFTDDWAQAWNATGFIWNDESSRLNMLSRWVSNSPTVIFQGWPSKFYSRVVSQLLERGTMTGEDVQAAWEHMKAAQEESDRRPEPRRRPIEYVNESDVCPWP